MASLKSGKRNRGSAPSLDIELSALKYQSIAQLRQLWLGRFGESPPPTRSCELLRQLLAWRLQAESLGDLDTASQRALTAIAEGLEKGVPYEPKIQRSLSPGVVLAREWKGTTHKVTITTNGFQYLGKYYRSLSDVARTITGTRWSGPRFFGLEEKRPRKTSKLVDVGETSAQSAGELS